MRKVFVTGGAGFIGSHLVEKLINRRDFVIVLDNFDPYYDPKLKSNNLENVKKKRNFVLVKGDVRNTSLVKQVISKYSPNTVIHFAAKVGVRNSIENPSEYIEVNVLGTLNILDAIKHKHINNFIFTSSSSVYGTNRKIPYSEEDSTCCQVSPYAVSKKSAELLCSQYASYYKISTAVLRLFTAYGSRLRPDLVVARFIKKIKNNEEIEIYGDGTSARDFVYIDDVISGIIKVIDKPFKFEIFNIGSSRPVTIDSLISYLEGIIGKKAKKKYFPFRKEDMKITHADITKSIKLLKWMPKTKITDGLKRIINS